MLYISIVLAILMIITTVCGLIVLNTKGYWLIDNTKFLSEMQKLDYYNKHNLKKFCTILSLCFFSLSAFCICIWLGCFVQNQKIILIGTIIEIIFILINVLIINFSKTFRENNKDKNNK